MIAQKKNALGGNIVMQIKKKKQLHDCKPKVMKHGNTKKEESEDVLKGRVCFFFFNMKSQKENKLLHSVIKILEKEKVETVVKILK